MPSLMHQLQAARPTAAELDTMWPEEQRSQALARVLEATSRPRRRRRRMALTAAASIAALGVVPNVLDSGEAAAEADLEALAAAALAQKGPVLDEGTFLHVRTEAMQRNSRIFGDGERLDTHVENWVRWDGTTWSIHTRPSAGWREHHIFRHTHEPPSLSNVTPEFAASLPDEPAALAAYLHSHVSGSSSHEEAVFEAVSELARSHFLPPETLAAALQVLAEVDGVETKDVTVDGRPAVEITYTQYWGLLMGREWITVDRATARVVSEGEADPGGTYESTTTLVEEVIEIPPDVREAFRSAEPGARSYD